MLMCKAFRQGQTFLHPVTQAVFYLLQEMAQFFLPLQVSEAWSVRAAHVHDQVVSEGAKRPYSLQIISHNICGQLVLPQVDA